MNPPSIPEPVVRFIESHVHSVLELEVLLLLREQAGEWTPARVASELRITEQSAELHLAGLSRRGLTRKSGPDSYTYAPRTPELGALVDELASCYANMRYTVINLIFAAPDDSVRTLAEAFRFRKRKGD